MSLAYAQPSSSAVYLRPPPTSRVPVSPPVPHRRAPRPPTWSPRRPRSRHMRIREPARCGLFTVSEVEEEYDYYYDHHHLSSCSHGELKSLSLGLSLAEAALNCNCASASSSSSTLSLSSSPSTATLTDSSADFTDSSNDTDLDTETETELETDVESVSSHSHSYGHSHYRSRSWASTSESCPGATSGSETEGESVEIATPSAELDDPFSLEDAWKDIDLSGVDSALQRAASAAKRMAAAASLGRSKSGSKSAQQQENASRSGIASSGSSTKAAPSRPKRPPPLDLRPYHVFAASIFTSPSTSPITPTGRAHSATSSSLLPALPIVSNNEWHSRQAATTSPSTPTFKPTAKPLSPTLTHSAPVQPSSPEIYFRPRSVSANAAVASSSQFSSPATTTSPKTPAFTPPSLRHRPSYTHAYSHSSTFPRSPQPASAPLSNENSARRAGSISALPDPPKTSAIEWRSRANSEPSPTTPTFASTSAAAAARSVSPTASTKPLPSTPEMITMTTIVVNPRTGARTRRVESLPAPPPTPSPSLLPYTHGLPTPPSATLSGSTSSSRSESPTTPTTPYNNLPRRRSRDALHPSAAVDLSSALQELLMSCGEDDAISTVTSSSSSSSSTASKKSSGTSDDSLAAFAFPLPPIRTPKLKSALKKPPQTPPPNRALPPIPEATENKRKSADGPLATDAQPPKAPRVMCSPLPVDRTSAVLLPPVDVFPGTTTTPPQPPQTMPETPLLFQAPPVPRTPETKINRLPLLPPSTPQLGAGGVDRAPVRPALYGNHTVLQTLSMAPSPLRKPSSTSARNVAGDHLLSPRQGVKPHAALMAAPPVQVGPAPLPPPPRHLPSRWSSVSIAPQTSGQGGNVLRASVGLFRSSTTTHRTAGMASAPVSISAPTSASSSPASVNTLNRRSLPRRSALPKSWKMTVV